MGRHKTLNTQIVHDAAAYLFWTLAQTEGVANANDAVIQSAGKCLLRMPTTEELLGHYGFHRLSPDAQRMFSLAIAEEAKRYAINEQNMDGTIYAEDAERGRSPTAQSVQTEGLVATPRRVVVSGGHIEKLGRLCLRHPLPAVVFSESLPQHGFIQVEDTTTALGFDAFLLLGVITVSQVHERLYALRGIFSIPVPDASLGDRWGGAIPNSSRFMNALSIGNERGTVMIEVTW